MDEGDSSTHSKPWTIEDLRNASTNWNLDGDRALLNMLESVHNNIIARTQNTASKLHSLNTELCRTSVSLKNVNNRFMGLSNIQFVESCVQEDDLEIIKDVQQNKDELIINPQLPKGKDPEGKEAERREALLQRVSQSCGVLEGLCERLDISPDSDSESDSSPEDTAQSIVLRPKDSYSETPLPYIIGSHKWQKKWHIGLHDCSSESDSDDDTKPKPAEEARYSSSEESQAEQHVERSRDERVAERKSQMSLPIPNQKQTGDGNRSSMTSTSTNNSSDAIDQEVAKINSNLKTPLDGEGSQENLDAVDSGQKKVPKVIPNASDFAAELARKLGGNVHSSSNVASASKNNAGKSTGRPGKDGAKSATTNKNKEGKSSGFDPMLRTEPAKRVIGNIFSDEPPPLDNDPYADTDDLFGDNDDDDDSTLFSSKTSSKPNPSKTFQSAGLFGNKQSSNHGGLFDDLPDENDSDDFDREPKKTHSKTKNLVAGKQTQPKNKHSDLFDASDEDVKPKAKMKGFFDDSDDEFFASSLPQSKKVDTKLTEVKNASQSKRGLFDNNSEVKQQKNKGLFEDSADDFDSSFEVTKKDVAPKEVKPNVNKGLFDDDDDDSDLFGGNAVSKVEETRKKVGVVVEDQKKGVKKPSLFGDDDSDDDGDLFASLKKKPAVVQSAASKKQVIEQKVDKIEPQQQATNIFGETIDTEPEDLFAPMKMPPKKLPEIKKVIASDPPEDKAVKEPALPNKPLSADSMFGDNTNILQDSNSIASSILAKRRKGSSSSESDKDPFKETFEKVGKRPGSVQQTEDTSEKNVNVVEKVKAPSKKTDAKGKPSEIQKKEQSLEANKEEIFKKIEVKPKPEVKVEQKIKAFAPISNVLDKTTKPIKNMFEDVDDDLFGAKKVAIEKAAPEKVLERSTSLFDDVPPPLDDEIPPPEGPRNVNSLFDYDDDEDLFSTIRNITKTSKSTVSSGLFDDLPVPVEEVRETKSSNVGLFFDEPPDLDDKDEPVGDSDMFLDYPYYKSVNIIRNNVEKVVDQYFVGKRDSSTVEEIEKVTTQSDHEEKVVENEQLHQKSFGVKSTEDFRESKTASKKSSVFDELSDDDGDLFSSLAKPKSTKENASNEISGLFGDVKEDLVPNFNQETEDKKLFQVRTDPSLKVTMDLSDKSKGLKDNVKDNLMPIENKMLFEVRTDPSLKVTIDLSNNSKDNVNEDVFPNVNKEEENKMLFEARADPSLKVSMTLSDKSKGFKGNVEEISAKPEELQSTPTLVKKPYIVSKPDIAKSKPEIKQTKPDISPVKPNIVRPKPKVDTINDKSNDFDQKSNEGDSKTDVKQTKPEISNVKPNIETKKPEIVNVKPNIETKKPEISSVKPNIEIKKPEIVNVKPNIETKRPEISSVKPIIEIKKPEIVNVKPNIETKKPEISSVKPIIEIKKPEIVNMKPNIETTKPKEQIESEESTKETKQDFVTSKPEIISTKPGIISPKPEHSSKMADLKSDEQECVKDIKQDIFTSKPEINARKPDIVSIKPGVISRKPEKSSNISETPSPTSIEINSAKSSMFDKFETKSSSTDSDASSSDAFADDKNKPKSKPEIKQIKPVITKEILKESKLPIQKDVSTEKTINTSVSELVNKAENDSPKQIFREEAKIVPSSSIGDIKAALSKKSKSSLDMSEEIDGGSHSSMKNTSKSENASPTKTVGKLNQSSLNINVKALIPGAAPKLVKEINEERRGIESTIVSPETSKPDDINYERKDSDPGSLIRIEHKRKESQPLIVSPSKGLDAIKSVSFDEDPKSLDSVLSNSLSKDRVKIRAKRRPSTRKARLEAVRKSTADILSFDETDYADMDYTSSLPTSPFDKSIHDTSSTTDKDSDFSSSLQSSFNDEDIIQTIGKAYRDRGVSKNGLSDSGKDVKKDFVKIDDSLKEINKVEVKTKKAIADKTKKVDDLFNIFKAEKSEEDIGDDLFGNIISNTVISEPLKKVKKNVSEAKPKKSLGLFGETDEDNDLFPSNANKKKNPTALFSDDSTEDLFSSLKPKETIVKTKKETPEIVKPKETVVKAKKDSIDSVKSQGAIRKITKTKNVFNDSDSDSDLFSSKSMAADQRAKPKTKGKSSDSKKQTDKSRNKLFGDSDSEDELFFKPVMQGKAIGGNRDKTKSLFDDQEDGDIFKTDKGAVKKTVLPSSRTQAKTQTNVVLSSAEIATQDPLSSFFS